MRGQELRNLRCTIIHARVARNEQDSSLLHGRHGSNHLQAGQSALRRCLYSVLLYVLLEGSPHLACLRYRTYSISGMLPPGLLAGPTRSQTKSLQGAESSLRDDEGPFATDLSRASQGKLAEVGRLLSKSTTGMTESSQDPRSWSSS